MAKKNRRKKNTAAAESPSKAPTLHSRWRMVLLQVFCIVAAGYWVFAPALHGDWCDDDKFYLPENPLRNDPHHLLKIWFMPGSFIEYYPITETVQTLQWHLWHTDSFGYILTNLILHVASALLIWLLLKKLGLRFAWLGGLLFAIHPLTVESVAWISELKNTLSLPPFLLAMCAWIDFEETRKSRDYWLALGLFLAAMLCKITMSPFPVVILLYAWWKQGRIDWRDLKISLPFFVVSLVLGMTTTLAGQWFTSHYSYKMLEIPVGGFFSRLALAGLSGSFYFLKFLWPWQPSPMYAQWKVSPPTPWQFLPWPVAGAAFYFCWRNRRSWGRHVLLGLGYFFLFLAPFVGFTKISYMMFTWVMDHFLYLPMIGLIGLIVAGLGCAAAKLPETLRPWGALPVALAIFLLARETHTYAGIYSNQEALCTYAIRLNPDARLARENLGKALLEKGELTRAIEQFEDTVKRYPGYVDAHFNLGTALMQTNRLQEAVDQFEETIRLNSYHTDAYDNLGATLLMMGHPEQAMERFRQALAISDYAQPHNDMGNALLQMGRMEEAIAEYQKALAIDPDVAQLHDNLGLVLTQQKRIPEAVEQFEIAAKIDPGDNTARNALVHLQGAQRAGP